MSGIHYMLLAWACRRDCLCLVAEICCLLRQNSHGHGNTRADLHPSLSQADGFSADIANMHIYHERLFDAMMHRLLRAALSPSDLCCTCVVGDLNDVPPEEGRLDMTTGALRFAPATPGSMTETLPEYVEVVPSGYTRRQYRDGEVSLLSRIDRVLCSLSTRALLQCRASTSTVRSIHDPHLPSDHAPVDLTLTAPRCRKGPRIPPAWVSRRPMFLERLDAVYASNGLNDLPAFEALATRTEVMHHLALDVARDAVLPGPTHVHHWRRHWLCAARAARAAWGRRDSADVARCVARIPDEGDLFLSADGTLQLAISDASLAERLGQANRAAVAEDLDRELGLAGCDAAKTVARARSSRRLASWSPSRRQLFSQVILDPDGEPAFSDDAAERLMFDHWGPVFSNESATDPAAVEWLLTHVQRWEGDLRLPEFDDFVRMVTRTSNTAPGPDGLSYSYWAVHPDNLRCLHSCLEALWRGTSRLPCLMLLR